MSVAISTDGRRIASRSSGSYDNTVRVWDAESGEELRCLRGHEDDVSSIAISSDGRRIVSGSQDKTVRVWDAERGEELRCLRGHEDDVSSVAISSDGRRIVSGSRDHTVRVWDGERGECLEVIEGWGDVQAIAAGFPFRALASASETVIEETTGRLMALFPVSLDHSATHPSGSLWAGTSASYVYVIALERS
jgi:WD40 repeat protein